MWSIITGSRRGSSEKGNALVELTLLVPWILFLFFGVVDLGFFNYSLIAVENAARVAAEHTSLQAAVAADQAGACSLVLSELAMLPNVGGLADCNSLPLIVTATSVSGPDGGPATSVSVTYQGNQLIPIPGVLMGRLKVTRNVQMRVRP